MPVTTDQSPVEAAFERWMDEHHPERARYAFNTIERYTAWKDGLMEAFKAGWEARNS